MTMKITIFSIAFLGIFLSCKKETDTITSRSNQDAALYGEWRAHTRIFNRSGQIDTSYLRPVSCDVLNQGEFAEQATFNSQEYIETSCGNNQTIHSSYSDWWVDSGKVILYVDQSFPDTLQYHFIGGDGLVLIKTHVGEIKTTLYQKH